MEQDYKIENELCKKVIDNSLREIYVNLKFMGLSLGNVEIRATNDSESEIKTFATDGKNLIYNPTYLLKSYGKGKSVSRAIIHSVLHCLFRHTVKSQYKESILLWNVATDIAVSDLIDGMNLDFLKDGKESLREEVFTQLRKKTQITSAEKIYSALTGLNEDSLSKIGKLFLVDEHSLWKTKSIGFNGEIDVKINGNIFEKNSREWEEIAQKTLIDATAFNIGKDVNVDKILESLRIECAKRYDFRQFLSVFLREKEIITQNQDEFDYIYYCYGLEHYKNMPLIENLEYESKKVAEDLVIVIDTSGSTSGELVKKFLSYTYRMINDIYGEKRISRFRIIQCDDKVRSDVEIKTREEFEAYMDNFKLIGKMGTDFTKAFDYVSEKQERKEYNKVSGLIYFTDGKGKFPKAKPSYETAFVFYDDKRNNYDTPAWAYKLIIDGEDLEDERIRC